MQEALYKMKKALEDDEVCEKLNILFKEKKGEREGVEYGEFTEMLVDAGIKLTQ